MEKPQNRQSGKIIFALRIEFRIGHARLTACGLPAAPWTKPLPSISPPTLNVASPQTTATTPGVPTPLTVSNIGNPFSAKRLNHHGCRADSRLPVSEPVSDADSEYVRAEAFVNVVEGYAGECSTRCDRAVASRSGVGSLAKIGMKILRCD